MTKGQQYKFSIDIPIKEAEEFKQFTKSIDLPVSRMVRFLIRDMLANPEAARQKIKERQESIKALGGKL